MNYLEKIMIDFELHSVEGIRECFEHGVDPNEVIKGKALIYELINMYTRGPLFKQCIQAFVDFGLKFEDEVLLSVLLDNASLLDAQLTQDRSALFNKYSFDCTFTPLYQVSLLHICAEYNHLSCAEILLKHGADINSKAGVDEFGFGGQTPIFHTVNQHDNRCVDVLQYLVSQNADLAITVKGLIWGKGYDWETFIPSVNPISYAMMGLLRQFQRTERQIYEVVSLMMRAGYGINYTPPNVPNKYLIMS
jgi:Ankyrin repeat